MASIIFLCLTPACKTVQDAIDTVDKTKKLFNQGTKTATDVKDACEDAAAKVKAAGDKKNYSSGDEECTEEHKKLIACCKNFGADMGDLTDECGVNDSYAADLAAYELEYELEVLGSELELEGAENSIGSRHTGQH